MNTGQLLEALSNKAFRKLTGPPEHWLTTVRAGFWGLELKHEAAWEGLQVGDLAVFHSTAVEYLDAAPRVPVGIIGVGIIGGKSRKTAFEWIGEIKTNTNRWPLLIHFSEVWWFGPYQEIAQEPMTSRLAKHDPTIGDDVARLTEACVTFTEMKDAGFQIPAQGAIQNISPASRALLVPLIAPRLKEARRYVDGGDESEESTERFPLNGEEDLLKNLARRASALVPIKLGESDEEAEKRIKEILVILKDAELQERATNAHQNTVKALAARIHAAGLAAYESVIDVLASTEKEVFIFEIKSIHARNFKRQTRTAIGQLLEYEYFEVRALPEYAKKTIKKGVVYSRRPPDNILGFLENCGYGAFWLDKGGIVGDLRSEKLLGEFLSA